MVIKIGSQLLCLILSKVVIWLQIKSGMRAVISNDLLAIKKYANCKYNGKRYDPEFFLHNITNDSFLFVVYL